MEAMAVDLFEKFSGLFWAESFWLPGNTTWKEIVAKRESGDVFLPLGTDLWAPFPIAIILLLLRQFWERCSAVGVASGSGRELNSILFATNEYFPTGGGGGTPPWLWVGVCSCGSELLRTLVVVPTLNYGKFYYDNININ